MGKQQAREAGAFEAWQIDRNGRITEGTSTNAWIVTADATVVTRAADSAILNGVTRLAVLDIIAREGYRLDERPFTIEEARTAREASSSTVTACLNTAWPSIFRKGSPSTLPPATVPGVHRMPACLPSALRSLAKMPGVSLACSTTAPAPSPNSTQVERSFQSRMRENTSAPITSAQRLAPLRMNFSAVASA